MCDIIGKKFNRLLVLEFSHNKKSYKFYKCICDCGNIKIVYKSHLTSGHTKSCGCFNREKSKYLNYSHGMCKTRFYEIWCNIKQRCYIETSQYFNCYGGRGIIMCESWKKSFINFRDDMYESYLKHVEEHGESNTTIDRIDVNGNYELSNCKWDTWINQANNRRDRKDWKEFKAISPEGEEFIAKNQTKFAKEHGLNNDGISDVLNNRRGCKQHKGWTFEYITQDIVDDTVRNFSL